MAINILTAPTPTPPNTLQQQGTCEQCIPDGMQLPVIIYLLQQIASNTQTPDQLMNSAKCMKCIPDGLQWPVVIYLLDQIVQQQ